MAEAFPKRPPPPFHPILYAFAGVISALLALGVFLLAWAGVGWALNRGTLWFEVPIVIVLMTYPVVMIFLLSPKARRGLVKFAERHGTDIADDFELLVEVGGQRNLVSWYNDFGWWWARRRDLEPSPTDRARWGRLYVLTALFVVAALTIVAFAALNALLVAHGVARVAGDSPPGGGRPLFTASLASVLIEVLRAVPLVDLPSSLRLDPPLAYTDRWTGCAYILFKLSLTAALVSTIVALIRGRGPAGADTLEDDD